VTEKINLPELPEGWIWIKIKDVCKLINGRAFKPSEWSSEGLPIIRIQNLNNPNAVLNYCNFEVEKKFLVNDGQLLFAWSGTPGTSFGAHIWNRGKAVLNQHIFKVEIQEEEIDKTYLMHLINHNVSEYIRKAHGTAGLAHITKGKFENSFISLPPFSEQKRIVDKIEELFTELDAGIKDLKSVKKELEVYRKSVLNAAFKGKQTKELKEFCDDVKSDIVDGPFGSNMKRSDYITEGIPVLKIQNIKPFNIVIKKMDYVNKEKYDELKRHSFKSGDIIITKLGDPLGVSAIVPKELNRGIIVADLVRVRATKINNDYLVYVLNSPFISNYINSKQKGTTRPRVRLSIVRELPIPYVEPEEQEQIVQEIESHFSVIDKLEETVDNALTKQEHLRKSILKNAFKGKLVQQDPSDEPAKILLERIKNKNRKYEQMRLT